ncbi:MAG: hypothetical protein KDK34_03605, partial [Leptospiraceae bacterium]|nr:hypothetical protein [Leptospiraceae bacterium]
FSAQRYFREEALKESRQTEKDRQVRRKTIFQPLTNPEMIDDKTVQHTPAKDPEEPPVNGQPPEE